MENDTLIEIPVEFKRLFDNDWREAAVYGGRFSLKSHTVARLLLIKGRQQNLRIACFREFQNSISDSSYQLLKDLIRQYKLADYKVTDKTIINTVTGTDFIFKGLWNNEQSIKSIEGIDIAWVEEAQTVTEESIDVLTPTVRKAGSQIIYTYNRLSEDDPVHKRLVLEGRPNTLIINVNYDIAIKHNMMSDVIRTEMEDDKANRPVLYKTKWLGEPTGLERKIYKNWAFIDEIPHEARLERYGLDFGYSNDPTAIVAVYYYNGGYILDEITFQKGLSNKQIADILKNHDTALVIADSAEPKSIAEIAMYGVSIVGAKKGTDSIRNGIAVVQQQRVSVTRRSINIAQEYKGFLWSMDRTGKILNEPESGFDHSMDAIRYAIETIAHDNYGDKEEELANRALSRLRLSTNHAK
jgi:phage terminase large subunit